MPHRATEEVSGSGIQKQGKGEGLGQKSLYWAIRVVFRCLVPGSETISSRGNIGLACEIYRKRVAWGINLKLIDLHMKSRLLVSPLLPLRIG